MVLMRYAAVKLRKNVLQLLGCYGTLQYEKCSESEPSDFIFNTTPITA